MCVCVWFHKLKVGLSNPLNYLFKFQIVFPDTKTNTIAERVNLVHFALTIFPSFPKFR